MKKCFLYLFPLCLLAVGGFAGCSKSQKTAVSSAGSANPPNVAPAIDAPVELKIKWQLHKKYFFRMETIQSWEATAPKPQDSQKVTLGMNHEYAVTVLNTLADGGRELELEFTAQKMFYQMGGIPMLDFDSAQTTDQDAGNPVAPVLRKLLGARIRCFTDANGKLVKTDGFKELMGRMAKGQPDVRAMLEQFFNEQNFRQLVDFAADLQPDGPLKIGETWKVHTEMPDPVGIMIMNMDCTLKNWEPLQGRQCVRFEYQGQVSSMPASVSQVNPVVIDDGSVSGKSWFDPDLGMMVNSGTEQHMTVKSNAQGKSAGTRFNMTVNFRLIRVADK